MTALRDAAKALLDALNADDEEACRVCGGYWHDGGKEYDDHTPECEWIVLQRALAADAGEEVLVATGAWSQRDGAVRNDRGYLECEGLDHFTALDKIDGQRVEVVVRLAREAGRSAK